MKNRRPSKTFILFILLLCLFHMQALAQDTRILLLTSEIQNSNQVELERRIKAAGMIPAANIEAMRNQLYAYHNITDSTLTVEEISSRTGYLLEVLQAQRLLASASDTGADSVILEGFVKIRFRSSSEAAPKELEAGRILIDFEGQQLSALGSVVFRDTQGTLLEKAEGEIVTFDWAGGDIRISKGTTSLSRENSEDVKVEFFTSGERVTFLGDGVSVQFDKGFITTNRENAYFSISAQKLLLLKGGDMFMEHAWISIGRIPLLWIPFFYYPGQTFVFNPAVGYDQDRGYFFSTTTELYGTYGKIKKSDESSLTTLLSSAEKGNLIPDGWVYRMEAEKNQPQAESKLASWATKSDSYLVLFADTYQKRGTFLGLDSNNNFSDGRYKLSTLGGLALWGNHTVASSVYDIPGVRYFIDGKLTVKTAGADLSLTMPFYSDPKVKIDYGNRLTSFSLGGLFGNQDFPDEFRSDITSFTWALDGSFQIPMESVKPLVTSLKVDRLNARVVWKANPKVDGPGYYIASMVVPDFRASVAGTLISWEKAIGQSTDQLTSPAAVPAAKSPTEPDASTGWDFKLTGVDPPYTALREPAVKKAVGKSKPHSLELSYFAEQLLANTYQLQNLLTTEASIYAKSQGYLKLKASISPDILNFETRLNPQFTYNSNAGSSTSNFQLLSDTNASIPYLGLSYALSAKLYALDVEKKDGSLPLVTETMGSWDSNSITTHRIVLSRPISLGAGILTASLTGVLPPLGVSITPKLQFKQGRFTSSVGYRLVEKTGGGFRGEVLSLQAGYDDNRMLSVLLDSTYDTSGYSVPGTSFTWDPFTAKGVVSLGFFEKKLLLTQKFDYRAVKDSFESLESSIRTPYLTATFKSAGKLNGLKPLAATATTQIKDLNFSWWKNRINLGLEFLTTFHYSFTDATATNLQLTAGMRFSIAEFLDIKLSITSVNKGFSTYSNFGDMMQDLFRSFDFFGTGRYRTQFNMDSVSLELVHHMDDWDLHCKYTGSVVLSNMEWFWKPVFTVFLQWKAIPEIKVDRRFDM